MGFYRPGKPEEPVIVSENRIKVNCLCWYYGEGLSMPVMIKFLGHEEEIITWKNIKVNFFTKKMYAGIPQFSYDCTAIVDNRKKDFKLSYFPNESTWYMQLIK